MIPGADDLLRELIRIPSVNPEGDPGTGRTGEAEIAAYLAELLRGLGAEVELREVEPGRPNVVARFPSSSPGKRRLLFAPHTDTVSVAGMTVDPFAGETRDGRIYGRGASDTKGSIAAMVSALAARREELADLSWEIWFAGLMNEEAGLAGSQALASEEHFDFVIVGEPTGLDVVHTTKGSTWLRLRTRGRSVHASAPDLGENAIYKMADAIRCIREEIAPALAGQACPVLGPPTISAGVVRGGSKINIVPESCVLEVDMRTVPGQDIEESLALLRAAAPGIGIDRNSSPPLVTDPGHPMIAELRACGASLAGAPWFCDASSFARAGMPSVAVGPGSILQAHTEDEFLALDDLREGVEFFVRFLDRLRAV